MKLEAAYCVAAGKHKTECQDTGLIGREILNDRSGSMVCDDPAWVLLMDGVGGNSGGKEASLFAAAELARRAPEADAGSIRGCVQEVNSALLAYATGSPGRERMATTMAGLYFAAGKAFLVNAGNSRVYVLQGSYLRQMSTDHTTYQMLVSSGNTAAAASCNRSEIIACLGGGKAEYLALLEVKQVFERGLPATVLVTTDGVHDHLSADEMEEILRRPLSGEELAAALCGQALENGSDDDRSVLLIHPLEQEDKVHE